MNLDFLKINSVTDGLEKFNLSWLTAGGLTVVGSTIELYIPILLQFAFIFVTQFLAFGVDFLRLKYLNQKTKTTVSGTEKKIKINTEFEEEKKEPF